MKDKNIELSKWAVSQIIVLEDLLRKVLDENYDLSNNYEISPELRDEIHKHIIHSIK